MKKLFILVLLLMLLVAVILGVFYFSQPLKSMGRNGMLGQWFVTRNPAWMMEANTKCEGAVFSMPSKGYIGFIWDDSFRPGHRHAGLDIFGGGAAGDVPVYAAYDGYLTRLPEWKSSLIIRIPSDPLEPGRQIWMYYTHMASPSGQPFINDAFPPGTYDKPVKAGDLLGYQGNYSGTPGAPTGIHLHFSIVQSGDDGKFLNELQIANTLDPSPYLGMPLDAETNKNQIPLCDSTN